MLIFYIVCGCVVFAISGVIMHINRRASYRRRIIRHFVAIQQNKQQSNAQPPPFVLTEAQEQQIKQCFLKGLSTQECIDKL